MTARRLVGRLQRQPKPGWRVVLLDECHAKLFPTRAPQWAKRGRYPEIPLLDRHGSVRCSERRTSTPGRCFIICPIPYPAPNSCAFWGRSPRPIRRSGCSGCGTTDPPSVIGG